MGTDSLWIQQQISQEMRHQVLLELFAHVLNDLNKIHYFSSREMILFDS